MELIRFFQIIFGISRKRKKKATVPDNVVKADFSARRSLTPYSKDRSNVATFKSKKEIFLRKLYDKFNAKDYEQNAFHHLIFTVDGQKHLFSIVELEMIGVFKYNRHN